MELGIGLTKIIPPIVYLGGLVVIFLTLFYKIEIGIYFLVLILPHRNLQFHLYQYPLGKDFIDLLFLVLIIKWFTSRPKLVKDPKLRKPLGLIMVAIFSWTFFTLWIGSNYVNTGDLLSFDNPRFVFWKNFIMLPLLYLIMVNNVKDEKQIKIILILMTISMLYMDRNFYSNFSGKNRESFNKDLRIEGTFSDLGSNPLAVFYAQNTIILLSIFFLDTDKKLKILFGVTIFFNYYCLMFLYSRGGYLATFVSLMFYGLIKDRRVLAILIVTLIFWQAFLPTSVRQRIEMTTSKEGDASIDDRFDMWGQAESLIAQNPILGYGFNITPYFNIRTGEKHRNSLHNGYLQLLLEQGAIGLLIFVIFFSLSIRYSWRLYRTAKEGFLKGFGLGFVGCVLAVLAGNIAGSYLFEMLVSGYYWVQLALIIRALEITNESKIRSEAKIPATQVNGGSPWLT